MRKLLIYFLFLFTVLSSEAQDVQFSQFYANSTFINPAFTGGFHQPRLSLHYRGQWLNLQARYNTMLASFDAFSTKYNSGIGVMLLRDVQGAGRINTTDLAFLYSYELKLNREWTVRAGGQGTLVTRSLDYSALFFPSQYDDSGLVTRSSASHDIGAGNITFFDVSFGGLIYSKHIWLGVAGHHLNEPNQSFINDGVNTLPMSLSLIAGYKFTFEKHDGLRHNNDEKSISPTIHYKAQGTSDQIDFGVYGHYNILLAGMWYRGIPFKKFKANIRNNESLIFMFGVRTHHFIARYSYDAVVSSLTVANPRGAHEIGITLVDIFKRRKRHPQRRLPCPNFI